MSAERVGHDAYRSLKRQILSSFRLFLFFHSHVSWAAPHSPVTSAGSSALGASPNSGPPPRGQPRGSQTRPRQESVLDRALHFGESEAWGEWKEGALDPYVGETLHPGRESHPSRPLKEGGFETRAPW
jgi:hypothetical protein